MKALVIEDTLTTLKAVSGQLERMGITPITARTGAIGLQLLVADRPDLILLDILLPDIDGYEVARRIRAAEKPGEWTPIIFLTARTKDEDVERGIEAGGDDYLVKPVSGVVLGAKVRAMQRIVQMRRSLLSVARDLQSTNRKLRRLSASDALTGIANRRHFDESLAREWRRAQRYSKALALVVCDVDFFKQFNDMYGHQTGDECLRAVARTLEQQARRPADLVARYGGEEFAIILPDTDAQGALLVAHRMREAVQAMELMHSGSDVASVVTVSAGVASCAPQRTESNPQPLVQAADAALYEAKRQGRNRVVVQQAGAVAGGG